MKDGMRRVLSLRFHQDRPSRRLTAEIVAGRNGPAEIYFACDDRDLTPSGDALLTLGYLPACELGYDLSIDGGVSRSLLASLDDIFALYARWYGVRRKPSVRCARVEDLPADDARRNDTRGTVLFFSGGVDSYYSLVAARGEIDALALVVGADLDPRHEVGTKTLRRLVHDTARGENLPAIVVSTDARRVFDRLVLWGEQYNGVMLAGIAHMLAGDLDRALVAGSSNAVGLADHPWGSHPDHEPRYSTDAMTIEHHGAIERFEKIRVLARDRDVLSALRVCWRTSDGTNCGTCSKCTQTRLTLRYLGGAEAEAAFNCRDRGDEDVSVGSHAAFEYWSATRAAALAAGDAAMAARIGRELARYRIRAALRVPAASLRLKRMRRRRRARRGLLF